MDETAATLPADSDFDKLLAKEKSLELSCFNNETFDQLYRVAEMMALTGTIPDSLRKEKGKDLPHEKVVANCFLVAEQAHRWEISPFAIVGHASIVYGKLGWEGKTVNALIQKYTKVRLSFKFNDKSGDDLGVTVIGKFSDEDEARTIQGTVKSWKTTGSGSPWVMSDEIALKRQLTYRGAREWKNIHAPGVMLGVMATDEIRDFGNRESATAASNEPINPFGDKPAELPEPSASSEETGPLITADTLASTNAAWAELRHGDADIPRACEYAGAECQDFADLTEKQGQMLLKYLNAKIDKVVKKADSGELNLEGGIAK